MLSDAFPSYHFGQLAKRRLVGHGTLQGSDVSRPLWRVLETSGAVRCHAENPEVSGSRVLTARRRTGSDRSGIGCFKYRQRRPQLRCSALQTFKLSVDDERVSLRKG